MVFHHEGDVPRKIDIDLAEGVRVRVEMRFLHERMRLCKIDLQVKRDDSRKVQMRGFHAVYLRFLKRVDVGDYIMLFGEMSIEISKNLCIIIKQGRPLPENKPMKG